MMRLSPVLAAQAAYPFVRLDEAKRRAAERGVEVIDFGMGDPREPTDPRIEQALAEALPLTSGYPRAQGLPELREAIARWCRRRFGVELDPEREIIPTLGSKEAIFQFAQVVLDPAGGKDVVVTTEPAYPVPERGAAFAGAELVRMPLLEENDFLPDVDAVDEELWSRAGLVWVNYPNNPTGATASPELYARLAALAREHEFVLASDEAYSELWFDEPPPSAFELGDLTRVAVFNSLSKRSSMTGYRSGFVAGDAEIVAALRAFRPNAGTAPQEFVQRASVVAWDDEGHVERNRALYARKRALVLDLCDRAGLRVAGSRATMYVWVAVPAQETSEGFAERLLEEAGVVVTPGSYLGESGEGYVRFALVPTEADCRRAVERLERIL